ncbi:MAG: tRNA 2-thiocytidine biosynthesis TtcA family protein [Angelakisella sp.]
MMRKAIADFDMLQDGDRVLVGVSGGKDSVALFAGLAKLQKFIGIRYEVVGMTLDPGFDGIEQDYSAIAELAAALGVEYQVRPTDIGHIVFDLRHEQNPCSLCARMRRGALHNAAKELGCNKVALGHHADDAAETLIMNLFNEGRIGCFAPVTYLSRKDITVIRPLVYAWEREVLHGVRVGGLPVVKSSCPVDKATNRQWTRQWLLSMEQSHPGITKRVYGAIQRCVWKNCAPEL